MYARPMPLRRPAVVALLVAACQSGASGGPAPAPAPAPKQEAGSVGAAAPGPSRYGRDIERLCNAEAESGALEEAEEARQIIVAKWLGANIETPEGHAFLAKIQPLAAGDKAAALDREAQKVGLAGCPLARRWKP
jgi:hypothetical protein